jgi:hypothetical protein
MSKEEKELFHALAQEFDFGNVVYGINNHTHGKFKFQLIFGCNPCGGAGDHTNHVHFGVQDTTWSPGGRPYAKRPGPD